LMYGWGGGGMGMYGWGGGVAAAIADEIEDSKLPRRAAPSGTQSAASISVPIARVCRKERK